MIVFLTSVTTSTLALFCSVLFRKTSVAMMMSYLVMALLVPDLPLAAVLSLPKASSIKAPRLDRGKLPQPLWRAFSLPLGITDTWATNRAGRVGVFFAGFVTFDVAARRTLLFWLMLWLLKVRWHMAG